MPLRRHDAPSSIPDSETIETLLGRPSKESPGTKTLQQLSDEERKQINLITFGRRQRVIQGDPEGIWFRWAGNVAHPLDPRMVKSLLAMSCAIPCQSVLTYHAVRGHGQHL
jgi:hypothetical protein